MHFFPLNYSLANILGVVKGVWIEAADGFLAIFKDSLK